MYVLYVTIPHGGLRTGFIIVATMYVLYVTIPHGGLRTNLEKLERQADVLSPSHTVGLEL